MRGAGRPRPWLLMTASYVALTLVMLSPLFSTGWRHSTVWPEGDASLSIWANGWVAHALATLHNPFFSPNAWSPHGLNLLANTTSVGLAIVFTPVTWLLGPIATFNVQLLVLPTVSALAMCWAVRPWVKSTWAVWIAGLAWGFCPIAVVATVWGWTNFLYLATAPLVFGLLADLSCFHRYSERRVGLLLGAVCAIQFFIGAEILAIVVVMSTIVMAVVMVVAVVTNRSNSAQVARRFVRAAPWTLVVGLVMIVPFALYALRGPAHLRTWVYPEGFMKLASTKWSDLISGSMASGALHPHWNPVYPSPSYFGPVLLAAVAVVVVMLWRRPVVQVGALIAIVGVWLARGDAAILHPWSVMWSLPAVRNIIASRFTIGIWFAVALLVALGFDRVIEWARRWQSTGARVAIPTLVLVATCAQLGWAMAAATEVVTQRPSVDAALPILAAANPGANVVTYPFPLSSRGLVQEAHGDFRLRLVGGWGPQAQVGTVDERGTRLVFTWLTQYGGPEPRSRELTMVARQFARWHVIDALSPVRFNFPMNRGYLQPAGFAAALTEIYGAPDMVAGEWVWPVSRRAVHTQALSGLKWYRCVVGIYPRHPLHLPSCVLNSLETTSTRTRATASAP